MQPIALDQRKIKNFQEHLEMPVFILIILPKQFLQEKEGVVVTDDNDIGSLMKDFIVIRPI